MAPDSNEILIERIQTLVQRSSPAMSDLERYLNHEAAEVRAAAYAALWNVPGSETLELLLARADSEREEVTRVATAAALGRFIWEGIQLDEALDAEFGFRPPVGREEIERARSRLMTLLADGESPLSVRQAALYSLCYQPTGEVRAQIEANWASSDPDRRCFALQCMGRTGERPWRARIIASIQSAQRETVLCAMEAAAEGCVEEAESALLAVVSGSDRELTLAAIWALRNVVHTPAGRRVLERLSRGKDPELKKQARATLQEVDAIDIEERPESDDE